MSNTKYLVLVQHRTQPFVSIHLFLTFFFHNMMSQVDGVARRHFLALRCK